MSLESAPETSNEIKEPELEPDSPRDSEVFSLAGFFELSPDENRPKLELDETPATPEDLKGTVIEYKDPLIEFRRPTVAPEKMTPDDARQMAVTLVENALENDLSNREMLEKILAVLNETDKSPENLDLAEAFFSGIYYSAIDRYTQKESMRLHVSDLVAGGGDVQTSEYRQNRQDKNPDQIEFTDDYANSLQQPANKEAQIKLKERESDIAYRDAQYTQKMLEFVRSLKERTIETQSIQTLI